MEVHSAICMIITLHNLKLKRFFILFLSLMTIIIHPNKYNWGNKRWVIKMFDRACNFASLRPFKHNNIEYQVCRWFCHHTKWKKYSLHTEHNCCNLVRHIYFKKRYFKKRKMGAFCYLPPPPTYIRNPPPFPVPYNSLSPTRQNSSIVHNNSSNFASN